MEVKNKWRNKSTQLLENFFPNNSFLKWLCLLFIAVLLLLFVILVTELIQSGSFLLWFFRGVNVTCGTLGKVDSIVSLRFLMNRWSVSHIGRGRWRFRWRCTCTGMGWQWLYSAGYIFVVVTRLWFSVDWRQLRLGCHQCHANNENLNKTKIRIIFLTQ